MCPLAPSVSQEVQRTKIRTTKSWSRFNQQIKHNADNSQGTTEELHPWQRAASAKCPQDTCHVFSHNRNSWSTVALHQFSLNLWHYQESLGILIGLNDSLFLNLWSNGHLYFSPSPWLKVFGPLATRMGTFRRYHSRNILSVLQRTHWGQRGSYPAGTLWVCWEFLSNWLTLWLAGRLRVFLKTYSPLWSQCDRWVHWDQIQNEPIKSPSRYFVNEPTRLFHNFDQNVPIMCLSHSWRVLSKNT